MQTPTTTVRLGKIVFRFTLQSKFTIIRGNSGIGKTTLIKMLDNPTTQIISPYTFVALRPQAPKIGWAQYFKASEDESVVFYADEDFPALYTREFQEAMAQAHLKFLIVVRDMLSHVPYTVNDVYTVVSEGREHWLERVYKEQELVNCSKFTTLATEDEKSGYYFFNSFLHNVVALGGKSKVFVDCKMRTHTLYVVDGIGFGAEIGRVHELLQEHYTNALYIIDSFEALVLHSAWIGSDEYPQAFEDNKEEFYTQALKQVMKNNGIVYSKSQPCKCFLLDCCYGTKCKLYHRGNKPKMILGSELYENLCLIGSTDNTREFA